VTTLPELVRGGIDTRCLVNGKLRKEGCEVKMTNAPAERLVIDLDEPGSPIAANDVRCDYLMIAEDGTAKGLVAALELKLGQFKASEIAKQLQAGASAAEQLVPAGWKIRFRPVAVSGRRNRYEISKLKKPQNMIAFRGHREAVRLMSCGESLTKVV